MMSAHLPSVLGFLGQIGPWQFVIIAIIGLLIFGKRLPEVGKSLGKGIVEFKKGLQGIDDELEQVGKPKPTQKLEDPKQRLSEDVAAQTRDKTQA